MKTIQVTKTSRSSSNLSVSEELREELEGKCENDTSYENFEKFFEFEYFRADREQDKTSYENFKNFFEFEYFRGG